MRYITLPEDTNRIWGIQYTQNGGLAILSSSSYRAVSVEAVKFYFTLDGVISYYFTAASLDSMAYFLKPRNDEIDNEEILRWCFAVEGIEPYWYRFRKGKVEACGRSSKDFVAAYQDETVHQVACFRPIVIDGLKVPSPEGWKAFIAARQSNEQVMSNLIYGEAHNLYDPWLNAPNDLKPHLLLLCKGSHYQVLNLDFEPDWVSISPDETIVTVAATYTRTVHGWKAEDQGGFYRTLSDLYNDVKKDDPSMRLPAVAPTYIQIAPQILQIDLID